MKRQLGPSGVIFALLLVVAPVAVAVDLLLLPHVVLPTIIFAIPILIAAKLLSPRPVLIVAAWTAGLEVGADYIQGTPLWLYCLYVLGMIIVTYIGMSLAAKNRQNQQLLDDMAMERKRLAAVLEQMPAGVLIAETPTGKLVLGNRQIERIFRHPFFPSSDIKNYSEYRGFHPDGRPYEPEDWPMARSITTGQVVAGEEIKILRGDGTYGAISVSSAPIRARDGRIVAGVAILADITERRQAERGLRESEDRYRALFNTIGEGFALCEVTYDETGRAISRLLDINPAGEELIGVRREDQLGKCAREISPSIERHALEAFNEVALTGKPVKFETYNQDFGKWLEGLAFSPTKGLVGVLFEDISDRKRHDTERERLLAQIGNLAESAQHRAIELEAILDNMVDSVFVCDTRGTITLANQSGVRLLGLSNLGELRAALSQYPDFLKMRYPDGTPVPAREVPLVLALGGKTVRDHEQLILNQKTGRDVYVRTSAAPIRNGDGRVTGAVAVSQDITDLTELDRLKEQFVSVAAHELKTPVAIMKGYSQALLRKDQETTPASRKMLHAIDRGADRIAGIVQDLLDISRLNEGSLELESQRVDLLDLVGEVVARMSFGSRQHDIRLAPGEAVFIMGDRDRLEQVVTDLIDNAVRYSPHGGDILVEVSASADQALISIKDHGVGIPGHKQGRIFERFYRAHTGTPHDYGGMGVGLYICREIISRHGGRIWFESDEGKGSTFYLSLPLAVEGLGSIVQDQGSRV